MQQITCHSDRPPLPRRGAMLIETAVGVGVTTILLFSVAQLVAVVACQQRVAQQQRVAAAEAANALERTMARSWAGLDSAAVQQQELTGTAAEVLDQPRLTIAVTDETDPLPARRVSVLVDWLDPGGRRVDPIQLTAWKYREAGDD